MMPMDTPMPPRRRRQLALLLAHVLTCAAAASGPVPASAAAAGRGGSASSSGASSGSAAAGAVAYIVSARVDKAPILAPRGFGPSNSDWQQVFNPTCVEHPTDRGSGKDAAGHRCYWPLNRPPHLKTRLPNPALNH